MSYNPRYSKPEAGNPFYNDRAHGGYSTCIPGEPTDPGCNVLANCVGYACGRFNEIIGYMKYPNLNCNAYNFITRANEDYPELEVTDEPTIGGIMVFEKIGANPRYGHVLVVEDKPDDNCVITSESAWGGSAFFNARRYKSNGYLTGYKYLGCIKNPAVSPEPPTPPTPVTRKFKEGDKVVLNGHLYADSYGNGRGQMRENYVTTIGIVNYDSAATKPYNVGDEEGWVDERNLVLYTEPQPTPTPSLGKGDTVEIIAPGKATIYGEEPTAYGIGWTRTILETYEGYAYPYQVGNETGTTGFYKADALRKL